MSVSMEEEASFQFLKQVCSLPLAQTVQNLLRTPTVPLKCNFTHMRVYYFANMRM